MKALHIISTVIAAIVVIQYTILAFKSRKRYLRFRTWKKDVLDVIEGDKDKPESETFARYMVDRIYDGWDASVDAMLWSGLIAFIFLINLIEGLVMLFS